MIKITPYPVYYFIFLIGFIFFMKYNYFGRFNKQCKYACENKNNIKPNNYLNLVSQRNDGSENTYGNFYYSQKNSTSDIFIILGVGAFIFLTSLFQLKNKLIYNIIKEFGTLAIEHFEEINYKKNETTKRKSISHTLIDDILLKLSDFERKNEFIEKGITERKLALKFGTNIHYLSYVVNTYRKMNFNNYLSRLRIEYITDLLNQNDKFLNYTIESLAKECGISSRQNFSDLFYKINGLRPTEFIKKRKKEIQNSKH